jgi:hypothetical protein
MKTIVMVLLLCVNLSAQIVISEVMSNEPQNRVLLEWIEIFNDADSVIDLHNCILIENGDASYFDEYSLVPPSTYAVLARRLVSLNSDSFEGHWGDSSGVWGDNSLEDFPAFNVDINLTNSLGFISITDIQGNQLDYCSWDSPSDDGYSIERDDVSNAASGWHQCSDSSGSTPGRPNSSAFASTESFSISVEPRIISIHNNDTDQLQIAYSTPSDSKLTIEIYDDSGLHRRKLLENVSAIAGQITWNGRDDNAVSLPPGVYIIMFTLTGERNQNKSIPVVIAP